ncbi:MAG TPA: DUF2474 family protein [Solimonas sp.]
MATEGARRLLWFVAIWAASVAALGALSLLVRSLIGA